MTRTRSIGQRSDWDSSRRASTAAGEAEDDDVEIDPNGKPTPSRTWSIYKEDANGKNGVPRPHDDPDDPINKYVQEQLERIRSHESAEFAEELAAQTDGATDEL